MTMLESDFSRREFLKLAATSALALAVNSCKPRRLFGKPLRRVLVLGIDGMDPRLLARCMAEGQMPNCKRLAAAGVLTSLATANPPQSPVAWSNFASGAGPGVHGIFDFVVRNPATYGLEFALAGVDPGGKALKMGAWSMPLRPAHPVNHRKGPVFWAELGKQGVPAVLLRMPTEFPPVPAEAQVLAGLGTPDMAGGYGRFTFITDDKGTCTKDVPGGRIETVSFSENACETMISGPPNPLRASDSALSLPLAIRRDPSSGVVRLTIGDAKILLGDGEWSDWIPLTFSAGISRNLHGMCRFHLKSAHRPFALHVSPINLDPLDPPMTISNPPGYSRSLAQSIGRFHTQGIAEDTAALAAGVLDDDEFRHQAAGIFTEQRRLFDYELGRFREGLFFMHFSSVDMLSHAFWRTLDPANPLHTPELVRRHGDVLPTLYAAFDKIIGEAMAATDDRTRLIVMSDHGFAPFRRQFELNAWLMDNGYSAPNPHATRSGAGGFEDIDWTRTRAYGVGINGLYLNRRGRERDGIVPPSEVESLLAELTTRLCAVRDPDNGSPIISNVYRGKEACPGPFADDAPDLIIGYTSPYRASWSTVLGGFPLDHITDNLEPWSGDHAFDAAQMQGILLTNRPLSGQKPSLCDLAPTILGDFGLPIIRGMSGRDLDGRKF